MTNHKEILLSFGFKMNKAKIVGYVSRPMDYINDQENLYLILFYNVNNITYNLYNDNIITTSKLLLEGVSVYDLESYLTSYFRKKKIKTFLNEN